jgi:hypothetical protein
MARPKALSRLDNLTSGAYINSDLLNTTQFGFDLMSQQTPNITTVPPFTLPLPGVGNLPA